MNVSQLYGALSRLLLYWATGYLPQGKASLVSDVVAVQAMLDVVSARLRRTSDEGDKQ